MVIRKLCCHRTDITNGEDDGQVEELIVGEINDGTMMLNRMTMTTRGDRTVGDGGSMYVALNK